MRWQQKVLIDEVMVNTYDAKHCVMHMRSTMA